MQKPQKVKNNKVDFGKIREIRSARRQKKGPWDESMNESGE